MASYMTGLLVLTKPIVTASMWIPKLLQATALHVRERLYVHLDSMSLSTSQEGGKNVANVSTISTLINCIYRAPLCQELDVRVILQGFKGNDELTKMNHKIDLVLFDQQITTEKLTEIEVKYKYILLGAQKLLLSNNSSLDNLSQIKDNESDSSSKNITSKIYNNVVLGGTFDDIHTGHKILLTESLLHCKRKLIIGLTDGALLKGKILSELIKPFSVREQNLREFITDIDPSVECDIVAITEPMGPTRYDPELEMIVVSEETIRGAHKINEFRSSNGLNVLDIHVVHLIEDFKRHPEEEVKISSSSQRMRLLGTTLKPPLMKAHLSHDPYYIGLTGGSASGKSSVAKYLETLGAGVIDCDKLGHQTYEVGTECYHLLIETFGSGIVNKPDNNINRHVLGSIVFGDQEKLDQLNSIVWPAIAQLLKKESASLVSQGKRVIVLDGALLLESKFDQYCHQVWVCIVDASEAVKRIQQRDGLTLEEAEKRIGSQSNNLQRTQHANVVFCSKWSYEFTRTQVDIAWKNLPVNL